MSAGCRRPGPTVIAISGGNIAILAAILLGLLRLLRVPGNTSAAVAIGTLLFYGELAGGGASVSRAVTAACVYLGGRILDHRGPPLNALAVAAAAGLAISPIAALDGGFHRLVVAAHDVPLASDDVSTHELPEGKL